MKKLKEARDIEKEILIAIDEGAGLDSSNTFFTNSWTRLNYNNNTLDTIIMQISMDITSIISTDGRSKY